MTGVPMRVIAALLLFVLAIGLLVGEFNTSALPTHAVIWAGLALAAYAAGLIPLVGTACGTGLGIARWQLGSWILVWYCIAFGLSSVTWSQPPTGTSFQIAITSVLRALWLITIGMTVWVVGYMIGPGMLRAPAARTVRALGRRFTPDVRSPATPWILYGAGTAARIVEAAATGRFGYVGNAASAVGSASGYQQVLASLALCAPLAVAAAALQVFRERRPGARITLAILFVAEIAFGAAAGGKQNFVVAVLAVAVPYSAARKRLPKTALVFFMLIFLFIVIPFTQAYRNNARGPSPTTPIQAVASAPGTLGQTVTDQGNMSAVTSSVHYALQRIREIDASAIILQRTPEQIAYLNPIRLVEEPIVSVVPRAIWPGKPILATGYEISQKYYGLAPTVYTSSAISQAADLYRYGGWVPVIAGMFLLGCGVRLLDDVLDVKGNPHAVFLVLLFFPTLVKNEDGWVSILAGVPGTVLIWLLAVSLTFRVRR